MWWKNLKSRFVAWMNRNEANIERACPGDPFAYMLRQGFQKVYLMGEDGLPYMADNLVGWYLDEEDRCWRFQADPADPDSWPFIDDAVFATIHQPEELIIQYVIDGNDQCWWSQETLVLERVTAEELLANLTPFHDDWELAARHMGLATISAWTTAASWSVIS